MYARCILDELLEATQAYLKRRSRNEKTGMMPVSTTSAVTCPPSCPFAGGRGCYAGEGPLAMHFRAVTAKQRGTPWKQFVRDVEGLPAGEMWRHNQAGDLPGKGEEIDPEEMAALVRANAGKRGYTYTHKYNTARSRELIRRANEQGFTVNLSANSPAHADELAALGLRDLPEAQSPHRGLPRPRHAQEGGVGRGPWRV